MLGLHRLQVSVVLTHFPHKSFFQPQHFVQLNQLLGKLSLPQRVMGCKGVLANSAISVLVKVLKEGSRVITLIRRIK